METGKITSKIVEIHSSSNNIDVTDGYLTFTDGYCPSGKKLYDLLTGIGGSVLSGYTNGITPFNTAFGYNAGTATPSGTYNTFDGYYAGNVVSTGAYNTLVGANSGKALTTAGYNTGIGSEALTAVTGAENTALGANAGDAITSGAYNVAIGRSADCGATSSNQIAIGYSAVSVGNNSIVIGSGVTGYGANTTVIGNSTQTDGYLVPNNLNIGDGAASSKTIYAKKGASNNPYLRFNNSTSTWQYSNDGYTYSNIGSSSITAHNSLTGIQGGSGTDGYYHLTATEHTWLQTGVVSGLTETQGGTGQVAYNTGDIIYSDEPNSLTRLSASQDGYHLEMDNGLPIWKEPNKVITTVSVGKIQALSTNTDGYLLPSFSESLDENFPAYVANDSVKLEKLTATMSDLSLAGADNVIVTVRKNHVDTSMTVTLDELSPANSGGTLYMEQDLTNTVDLVNGDKVTVRFVHSGTNPANNVMANFNVVKPFVSMVPWSPNILSSKMVLWLRASDVVLSGSDVIQVNDKSGKGHNAVSTGVPPSIATGYVNGKAAVYHDGTPEYLSIASHSDFDLTSNMTMFVVGRCDSGAISFPWAVITRSNGPWDMYNHQLRYIFNGTYVVDAVTTLTQGAWHRLGIRVSGTTGTEWLDGANNGTGTVDARTAANYPVIVGTRQDLFTRHKGHWAEILLFNQALSDDEMIALDNWAKTEYAL